MAEYQGKPEKPLIEGLAQVGRLAASVGRSEPAAGIPSSSKTLFDGFGYPAEFVAQLDRAIVHARKRQVEGSLLVISIDNLAMILSAYGHELAEQMMRYIDTEIKTIVDDHDVVSRIQRDQFGIVLQAAIADEAHYIAERLISHIRQLGSDFTPGAVHIICSSVCVGFPDSAVHARDALDKAYVMQFNSPKCSQVHHMRQQPQQSAYDRQEMGLAHYLGRAIREDKLLMAYQPIIDARTGAVAHYEALLRMRGDDGRIASAGALIPIAERMGLIDTIDELVLKRVVEELAANPDIRVAFNVSNLTTRNRKWIELFARLVDENANVAPRMIVEITETAAQLDLGETAYFVAEIQSYGALVALDDFGAGYTSFRQLKSLSVDMVKIDGAFVKDLVDNADNRFFVRTLLEFTKGFGLKSVAEFVENGEIAKMLMELGVDYLQGYYFGHPDTNKPWANKTS